MQYNNFNNRSDRSGGDRYRDQYDYFDDFDDLDSVDSEKQSSGRYNDEPYFDDEFSEEDNYRSGRQRSQDYGRNGYGRPSDRYNERGRGAYPNDERYSRKSGNTQQGRSSGKKLLLSVLLILILLNLGILAYVILDHTYAFIGSGFGHMYPVKADVTELDLSDKNISGFDGIEKLDKLQSLDIRGMDVSLEQYESLRTKLPSDCRILWNIKIGGHSFESTSSSVSFSDVPESELDSLKYFNDLKAVNASGCVHYSRLKELALSNPDCDISWTIPIGDKTYSSDISEFKLTDDLSAEQIDNIVYFPWLVYIDATEYSDYETLLKLNSEMPSCEISWKLNLAGVSVSSSTSSIDLSRHNIGNLANFKQSLSYLPNLKYINMCDCDLSDDQMGDLCRTFPDKKFVWYVIFGQKDIKTWKVRTDITAFSTLNPSGGTPFKQEDFAPLFLYCTDLVAIDLGHNSLTDISLMSNLKKLKYAILADNEISDLTPLSTLEDLQYIEIFDNRVSDVRPLQKLKKLYDLDLTNNYITDITQFYPMKNLLSLELDNSLSRGENIRNNISAADINKLSAALPQCYIVRKQEDAYRYAKNNVRFMAMKLAFNNQNSIVYYNGWEDIKFYPSFYN